MKFKKYTEYLDRKDRFPSIRVRTEVYVRDVEDKLAGLVLRNNEFHEQAKELLINLRKMDGLRCDFADNIRIAMTSRNVASMRDCLAKYGGALDERVRAYLESCIFNYESKCMGQTFSSGDVDVCVETLKDECESRVGRLSGHIFQGLQMTGLNHLEVDLEVNPAPALTAETATATFGAVCPFRLVVRLDDCAAEGLPEELPAVVLSDREKMLKFFGKGVGRNGFFTGYLADESGSKSLYEAKQRDMALGMKTFIERGSVLHLRPPSGNCDVWQVKVKNPRMSGSDGRFQLSEDAQLRWIDLIRRRRYEG